MKIDWSDEAVAAALRVWLRLSEVGEFRDLRWRVTMREALTAAYEHDWGKEDPIHEYDQGYIDALGDSAEILDQSDGKEMGNVWRECQQEKIDEQNTRCQAMRILAPIDPVSGDGREDEESRD